MKSKHHATSTKSNSSAPVCDGHHHWDRPPERKKMSCVDDSDNLNDKLLSIVRLNNLVCHKVCFESGFS